MNLILEVTSAGVRWRKQLQQRDIHWGGLCLVGGTLTYLTVISFKYTENWETVSAGFILVV